MVFIPGTRISEVGISLHVHAFPATYTYNLQTSPIVSAAFSIANRLSKVRLLLWYMLIIRTYTAF
jgi:hypothetical protein